jgi:hypothetical protein
MTHQCKSYKAGQICRDGFPIGYPASSACTGYVCSCCKRTNEIIPALHKENLGLPWISDDGIPVLREQS